MTTSDSVKLYILMTLLLYEMFTDSGTPVQFVSVSQTNNVEMQELSNKIKKEQEVSSYLRSELQRKRELISSLQRNTKELNNAITATRNGVLFQKRIIQRAKESMSHLTDQVKHDNENLENIRKENHIKCASAEEKYKTLVEKFNQYLEVYSKFPFASEYNNEHAKFCEVKSAMEDTGKRIESIKKEIAEMNHEISEARSSLAYPSINSWAIALAEKYIRMRSLAPVMRDLKSQISQMKRAIEIRENQKRKAMEAEQLRKEAERSELRKREEKVERTPTPFSSRNRSFFQCLSFAPSFQTFFKRSSERKKDAGSLSGTKSAPDLQDSLQSRMDARIFDGMQANEKTNFQRGNVDRIAIASEPDLPKLLKHEAKKTEGSKQEKAEIFHKTAEKTEVLERCQSMSSLMKGSSGCTTCKNVTPEERRGLFSWLSSAKKQKQKLEGNCEELLNENANKVQDVEMLSADTPHRMVFEEEPSEVSSSPFAFGDPIATKDSGTPSSSDCNFQEHILKMAELCKSPDDDDFRYMARETAVKSARNIASEWDSTPFISSTNSPFNAIHDIKEQACPTDNPKLKPEKGDFNFAVPSGRAPGRKEKRHYVSSGPGDAPSGIPMNWSDSESLNHVTKISLTDEHETKDSYDISFSRLDDAKGDFSFNFGGDNRSTKFPVSGFTMFADEGGNFASEADEDAHAFSNFMSADKEVSSTGTDFASLFGYENKNAGGNDDQTKGSFQFTF